MSDTILLTVDDGLARVTFNRPAFLNAMDFEMGTRWRDVAQQVVTDPSVGAVIVDAAGPDDVITVTPPSGSGSSRAGRR